MLVVAFQTALDIICPPKPEPQPEPRGLLSLIFDEVYLYVNPLPPILHCPNVEGLSFEGRMSVYKAFDELCEATALKYGY